jgi:hypothetical protein
VSPLLPWIRAGVGLLLAVCSGCFPQAKSPVLVSNVSSFYLDVTERQAGEAGVDYRPAVNAALSDDAASLQSLFRLTNSGVLDGSGAESHAAILWCLMRKWGDRNFHEILAGEDADTRQQVVTYLDFAADSDYQTTYPLTYGLGRHTVRFGG